jgi:phosphatidylglycerophosphate synthase
MQPFERHALHMVFWLMTMSGGCVCRMLGICRVVVNCATYLSQSFVTVVPLILLLYGCISGQRSVMTFVGLYNKKTYTKIQQKKKSLIMAYISLINLVFAGPVYRTENTHRTELD